MRREIPPSEVASGSIVRAACCAPFGGFERPRMIGWDTAANRDFAYSSRGCGIGPLLTALPYTVEVC